MQGDYFIEECYFPPYAFFSLYTYDDDDDDDDDDIHCDTI